MSLRHIFIKQVFLSSQLITLYINVYSKLKKNYLEIIKINLDYLEFI